MPQKQRTDGTLFFRVQPGHIVIYDHKWKNPKAPLRIYHQGASYFCFLNETEFYEYNIETIHTTRVHLDLYPNFIVDYSAQWKIHPQRIFHYHNLFKEGYNHDYDYAPTFSIELSKFFNKYLRAGAYFKKIPRDPVLYNEIFLLMTEEFGVILESLTFIDSLYENLPPDPDTPKPLQSEDDNSFILGDTV